MTVRDGPESACAGGVAGAGAADAKDWRRDPVLMNINAFVSILAGVGLFVIGIKAIAGNMSQLAGRRVRGWLARSTDNYAVGAAVGMIAGALTRSTNAITVILMSLLLHGALAP